MGSPLGRRSRCMDRAKARRQLIALGVSLGVHLCVLAAASQRPSASAPSAAGLELTELVWTEAVRDTPSPPAPNTPMPPPVGPQSPKKEQSSRASPAAPGSRQPRPLTASGSDTPRAIDLASPNAIGLPSRDEGARRDRGDAPRGVTLHPGDLPGDDELLADEEARVSARVGTWLRDGLAAARVRGGLPDQSLGELGAALRSATDEVPRFIDTNAPKEIIGALLESWGAGAQRYGKTGAPYATPEGYQESIERPSELANAAAKGSADALATAGFLSAGARLQEFADGRAGLELYALVEILQQSSGTVDRVSLIRASGLGPFDAWVTERARQVAAGFAFDAGARSRPLRSVWRFDGVILYRRKLKLKELDGRAVIGMMTMSALSMLSGIGNQVGPAPGSSEPPRELGPRIPALVGRFDELNGAMDVVDLTNPTYDCRVTLLQAD
jgi:hypothetical protein